MLRLKNYFIVANITEAKMKRAASLQYAGEWVFNIFTNLPDTGEDDNFDSAVQALNSYFNSKNTTNFEIFKFREAAQQSENTLTQFLLCLRKMSANCSFHPVDGEIKNQTRWEFANKPSERPTRSQC